MGKLNDIRDKLLAGSTTKQLIEQGYAKSSVFQIAKKLRDAQSDTSSKSMSDEIQDLKHQRDVLKLKLEISQLEAAKENLPDRVAKLEKTAVDLESLLCDAVDSAISVCLRNAGMDKEKAIKFADGWVERNIMGNKN